MSNDDLSWQLPEGLPAKDGHEDGEPAGTKSEQGKDIDTGLPITRPRCETCGKPEPTLPCPRCILAEVSRFLPRPSQQDAHSVMSIVLQP
jgi:hypothetical protein